MKRTLIAALSAAVILWVAAFFMAALACDGVTGRASFYCCEHHGRATASGEIFNQNAMTAAMPNRSELGRVYKVTYQGKSVVVRITDLGPHKRLNRIIDLSRAAAEQLGMIKVGVASVCIDRIR